MNVLKRILSLTFLTLMLGIPIYSLTTHYLEAEAAVHIPVLKIRYLDKSGGKYGTGVYHDDTYKQGGQVNEDNSINNDCMQVLFCEKGVKDPYSGKTVKMNSTQYTAMVNELKSLPKSSGKHGVEVEKGNDVRYIVWYQFDKEKESTNFWRTEKYQVQPAEINVTKTTSDTINTKCPGFELDRASVASVSYTGENNQPWVLSIYAVRYDHFRDQYESLPDNQKNAFGKEGGRVKLYLQPVIRIYRNEKKSEACYNLQKWIGAMNWSNSSTYYTHYNLKVTLNLTNYHNLFVHYVQENTVGMTDENGEHTYGIPVVDESGSEFKEYSIHNYTPGDDDANKANGIEIASPQTFALKNGPVKAKKDETVDIWKDTIEVKTTDEEGEEITEEWHVSGALIKYIVSENKIDQWFRVKFLTTKDGTVAEEVKVVKDTRDRDYRANDPQYSKGDLLTYDDFLAELAESKYTTASAGDSILYLEYAKVDLDEDPGPYNREHIKIEYQYQTFDEFGNVVWKEMKEEEAEAIPNDRIWSKDFPATGKELVTENDNFKYYGIYSVHATDNVTGQKLKNQLTNDSGKIAQNFYDTSLWEAEADTVRKVKYQIPKHEDVRCPVTVTVRYAARMPMVKLSYLATKVDDGTYTYKMIEDPVNLGLGGPGQKQPVSWLPVYTENTTALNPETGLEEPVTLEHPFEYWYTTEGDVKDFCKTPYNCWTETEPPGIEDPIESVNEPQGTATYREYNPTVVVGIYGEAPPPFPENKVTIKYEYQTFNNGEVVWKELAPAEEIELSEGDTVWSKTFHAYGNEVEGNDDFKYYGIYSVYATNNANGDFVKNQLTVNDIYTLEYFNDDPMWLEKNDELRTVQYDVSEIRGITIKVRYAASQKLTP